MGPLSHQMSHLGSEGLIWIATSMNNSKVLVDLGLILGEELQEALGREASCDGTAEQSSGRAASLTGQGKNLLRRNGLHQAHGAYLKNLCSSSVFLEDTAEVWLCNIEIRWRKLAKLHGCAKQSQKNCRTADWRESESDWTVWYQNSKIKDLLIFPMIVPKSLETECYLWILKKFHIMSFHIGVSWLIFEGRKRKVDAPSAIPATTKKWHRC